MLLTAVGKDIYWETVSRFFCLGAQEGESNCVKDQLEYTRSSPRTLSDSGRAAGTLWIRRAGEHHGLHSVSTLIA